jgi:hypothetical protein
MIPRWTSGFEWTGDAIQHKFSCSCSSPTSQWLPTSRHSANSWRLERTAPTSGLPVNIFSCINIQLLFMYFRGSGSSVGIATGYGLDGPGDRILMGTRFSANVHTGPETYPAFCTLGTGSFPAVKRPGRSADHPPLPSAEVENEYSFASTPPLGPWWPVIG